MDMGQVGQWLLETMDILYQHIWSLTTMTITFVLFTKPKCLSRSYLNVNNSPSCIHLLLFSTVAIYSLYFFILFIDCGSTKSFRLITVPNSCSPILPFTVSTAQKVRFTEGLKSYQNYQVIKNDPKVSEATICSTDVRNLWNVRRL